MNNKYKENVYYIENSYIIITKAKIKKSLWKPLIRGCLGGIIALIILYFTILVFGTALSSNVDFYDTISLGAVFATIGSTFISIASLICTRNYEEFSSSYQALQTEFDLRKMNEQDFFLKEQDILIKKAKEIWSYKIICPQITFEIGTVDLKINIPTHKKDFHEWELLKSLIRMKLLKTTFIKYTYDFTKSIEKSGIYVWECVYHTLLYALYYKINYYVIILGIYLFVSGIIVTFTYPLGLYCYF